MKSPYPRTLAAVALLGVLFAAPPSAATAGPEPSLEEVKAEIQRALRTLSTYTADQRDDALEDLRRSLAQLDRGIERLERRIDDNWTDMTDVARRNARASLRTLRAQRLELAEWYGGLKRGSAGAWDELTEGFAAAYAAVATAWEDAERELSESRTDG
jgi:ABC-type transporter Mla subunit MlaD